MEREYKREALGRWIYVVWGALGDCMPLMRLYNSRIEGATALPTVES